MMLRLGSYKVVDLWDLLGNSTSNMDYGGISQSSLKSFKYQIWQKKKRIVEVLKCLWVI